MEDPKEKAKDFQRAFENLKYLNESRREFIKEFSELMKDTKKLILDSKGTLDEKLDVWFTEQPRSIQKKKQMAEELIPGVINVLKKFIETHPPDDWDEDFKVIENENF